MMRAFSTLRLLPFVAIAACSLVHPAVHDAFTADVGAPSDSVMRVARTQLTHHGYAVITARDGSVFTAPRPIAKYQASGDTALRRRSYTLHVEASKHLFGSARVTVRGYVLPPGTSMRDGVLPSNAMLVNDANVALFADVRAAGGWIADESNRLKSYAGKK